MPELGHPATELGHPDHTPASPSVDHNVTDLLAQATEAAQIEVNETPDFVAIPLSSTGPADPRYFVFGAPSIDDPSPNARLINETRERHERMGLGCVFSKVSAYKHVCDPEGGKLTLT